MSIEAIKHYEAALKEAFPSGATGDVFFHWNEARKAIEQEEQAQPVAHVSAYELEQFAKVSEFMVATLRKKPADGRVAIYTAPPPRHPEQAEQKENLVGLPPEAKGCVTILIQGTRDDGQQINSVMRFTEPCDILSLPHRAEQLARVFHNQFAA